tara:strand:+ start:20943 stop:21365 length:423 start_codon:yes stop_codon:yes gene_type:complete
MLPQIIVASTCVLITLYGVFKKNRVFFNIGYFVYGLIVIFSEINFYIQDQEVVHIATASLWLIQSSLALPNKLPYDGSKIAKSAGIKIYICLSIINLYGIFIVCASNLPDFISYFHAILAILPLIAIYLILNNKIEISKS